MLHKILLNATFHSLLISIDQELAETMQKNKCPCGGILYQSHYPRSPLGVPPVFRSSYDKRFSYTCSHCYKRFTSASVRFFGRRWYPAPLFILISALMLGINERRLSQVKQHFGISVSERTWKRWRQWWRERFTRTPFWQQAKGFVLQGIQTKKSFPRVLLSLFKGTFEEKMTFLLRFLSPLTRGLLRAV